jgi:hypothetical protein
VRLRRVPLARIHCPGYLGCLGDALGFLAALIGVVGVCGMVCAGYAGTFYFGLERVLVWDVVSRAGAGLKGEGGGGVIYMEGKGGEK